MLSGATALHHPHRLFLVSDLFNRLTIGRPIESGTLLNKVHFISQDSFNTSAGGFVDGWVGG